MSYRFFNTRQVRQTLWIELHNPPANFLTTDVLAELYQIIRAADKNDSVRVVVFTGGLPDRYVFHFSIPEIAAVGPQIKALRLDKIFRSPTGSAIARWQTALSLRLMQRFPAFEAFILNFTRRFRGRLPMLEMLMQMMAAYYAIENCRKITIAAINGSCNGGGTEMGACFDFRFMVGDGGFAIGQPEVLIGILPGGGGTQRVARLLGKAKAVEFILACNQWTPQVAKAAGLITDCFPKATFVEDVQAFADRMSRRSLVAFTEGRKAITQGLESELSRGLAVEMAGTVHCCSDPGAQGALDAYAAYLQKEVLDKPESGATFDDMVGVLESERITRNFTKRGPDGGD